MAITYNPYGWKIRPCKTELQETIEQERELHQLEEQIAFLMSEANARINQFISHNHDPVLLLIELDRIFPEVEETIEAIAKLNREPYELVASPIIP